MPGRYSAFSRRCRVRRSLVQQAFSDGQNSRRGGRFDARYLSTASPVGSAARPYSAVFICAGLILLFVSGARARRGLDWRWPDIANRSAKSRPEHASLWRTHRYGLSAILIPLAQRSAILAVVATVIIVSLQRSISASLGRAFLGVLHRSFHDRALSDLSSSQGVSTPALPAVERAATRGIAAADRGSTRFSHARVDAADQSRRVERGTGYRASGHHCAHHHRLTGLSRLAGDDAQPQQIF